MQDKKALIEVKHLTKNFGALQVLNNWSKWWRKINIPKMLKCT